MRWFGNKRHSAESAPKAEAKKSVPSGRLYQRILVPVVDAPFSPRGLEIACRLAQESGASVLAAYFIEVPRALSLDMAMPDTEAAADHAITEAQATARPFKSAFTAAIHRARDPREGIMKLLSHYGADLLVLGGEASHVRGLSAELLRELFFRAPCEVIVDYMPGAAAETGNR